MGRVVLRPGVTDVAQPALRGGIRPRAAPHDEIDRWPKYDNEDLPQDEWEIVLPDVHEGYITWQQFQRNQQRLRENAQAHGAERRQSPAGEGPALLQGLAVCGLCGQRMAVRTIIAAVAWYRITCANVMGSNTGSRFCQQVPGAAVDEAIGALLLEKLTPVTLNVALAVGQELEARQAEADALRRQQVERARYEADLARARYMEVDPKNRLVADSLEADWNEKLRAAGRPKSDTNSNAKPTGHDWTKRRKRSSVVGDRLSSSVA